jgi:hypothetical protein
MPIVHLRSVLVVLVVDHHRTFLWMVVCLAHPFGEPFERDTRDQHGLADAHDLDAVIAQQLVERADGYAARGRRFLSP